MENKNLFFLIESKPINDVFTLYSHVSINGTAIMPYKQSMLQDHEVANNLVFGTLFESVAGRNIPRKYYNEHDYDLAVVLGEDVPNQELLVFGNKIGEQIISKNNTINRNYRFYQRGDKLLLHKVKKGYEIIHNVSQAMLKYNMQQMSEKL